MGLLGLGVGVGVLIVARFLRPTGLLDKPGGSSGQRRGARRAHAGRWLAASLTVGVLAGVVTGWVVGALLAAMAVWALPGLGGTGVAASQSGRLEGIAGWTEMLRDTLAAAAGLEQTIVATASTAPQSVRPQIQELAARLEDGERLPEALRRLADDFADPTADLVIAALVLAAEHEARHVGSLLGELAATARSQVEMHQRVDAGRARTRTTLRVVVGTTVCFAGGLIVLNPAFLKPYSTVTGQLVLLGIGVLFAVAFAWLRRMARIEQPTRFFATVPSTAARGDVARQEVT
jgi:Flp pilus assembly protein TadB